jgi:hypothetical protein
MAKVVTSVQGVSSTVLSRLPLPPFFAGRRTNIDDIPSTTTSSPWDNATANSAICPDETVRMAEMRADGTSVSALRNG